MIQERLNTSIDRISFSDTTQREGRQSEGVHLSPEASVEHARLVDEVGIDYLELNHPASSPTLAGLVEVITNLGLKNTKVVTHVKCNERDVQTAINAGAQGINTYVPIKPNSLESVQKSIEEAVGEHLPRVVELTRKNGIELRVSIEHAFSLPPTLLRCAYREISHVKGVHRVGMAETTGICFPWQLREYATAVYQEIPKNMLVQFHMHNDNGLVAAKFLTILELLAHNGRQALFDISVAGFGERNGILSYGDVFVILNQLNPEKLKKRYTIKNYGDLVRFIEEEMGVPLCRRDPLNPWAFSHSAGPHLNGMVNGNSPYQAIPAKDFGFEVRLNVGHAVTGWQGLKYFAQKEMGLRLEDEKAKKIAAAIREHASVNGPLADEELRQFIQERI